MAVEAGVASAAEDRTEMGTDEQQRDGDPGSGTAPDGRERELKFDLPAGALKAAAKRLSQLEGASRRRSARLVSVYFDTPSQDLRKNDVTLRIRRNGRRRIQTLKHGAGGFGLFDRLEIERAVKSDAPALNGSEAEALAAILGEPLDPERALAAAFTTVVRRAPYDVMRGDAVIEIALDDAAVEAGGRTEPFCELELELRAGDPAELFRVARELAADIALRIGVRSKSSRGYALLDGAKREPTKAGPSPVRPEMDVAQAFAAIVADCVIQFRMNEDVLLAEPDEDAIHQARVALRRLRSAFSVFGDAIEDPRAPTLAAELKWLAGALGDARNFDVLIRNNEEEQERAEQGADGLAERLEASREQAYAGAMEALHSRRALDLMIDLAEWTETGAWRTAAQSAELRATPVEKFAADVLDRRLERLRKKSRKLGSLTPEKRHRARIEAKKLRYASDFFAPLFAGGRLKTFSRRLARLQDELGELNDIATAQSLTYDLARDAGAARDGGSAFAAGRLAGKAEVRAPDLVHKAEKRLAKLRKAKPFWR